VIPDRDTCLAAVASRDARFDGTFYTGRDLAPASTADPPAPPERPRPAHLEFHASAASAQAAGFRACKRCRPDAVPGLARVGRPRRRHRTRHAAHRGRGRRPRGRRRSGVPAGLLRASGAAPHPRRVGRHPAEPGSRAARPHRPRSAAPPPPCRWPRSPSPRGSARSARSTTPCAQVYAATPSALRRAGRAAGGHTDSGLLEICGCGWRSGPPSTLPTCSATSPRPRCPASRSGATAPTAARCGCHTARLRRARPARRPRRRDAAPQRPARPHPRHRSLPPPPRPGRRPGRRGRRPGSPTRRWPRSLRRRPRAAGCRAPSTATSSRSAPCSASRSPRRRRAPTRPGSSPRLRRARSPTRSAV
jgi:hypothetical protein